MPKKLISFIRLKTIRIIAGILILCGAVFLFISYAAAHPDILTHLATLSPLEAGGILGLYFVFLAATSGILAVTVRMCKHRIAPKEGLLLTIYSTIVNFFGPLQSGPGFRALYLKKKHAISLRDYGAATLYYYLFFAFYSGLFLLIGFLPSQLMSIIFVVFIATIISFIVWQRRTVKKPLSHKPQLFLQLAAVTFLQVAIVGIIYCIELRSIDANISLQQAFTYTGAANFALFVSLTPGSIGIRESFLLFSQQLHGIDSQTVIAASVIDRAFYFVFLGLLFVLATLLHARDRLTLKHTPTKRLDHTHKPTIPSPQDRT